MDLYRIIAELTTERERVQRIIESLESMLYPEDTGAGARPTAKRGRKPKAAAKKRASRRGRPPMSAAEREAQSARMKSLWEKRRAEKAGAGEPSAPSA